MRKLEGWPPGRELLRGSRWPRQEPGGALTVKIQAPKSCVLAQCRTLWVVN